MKARTAIALALTLACWMSTAGCGGESGSSGKIYGQIINYTTRAGIEGATITIYNDTWESGGSAKTATSTSEGFFEISSVTPGTHLLQVAADGYATHRDWVILQDGESVQAAGTEGRIALQLGCNVTVYAMFNGTAVAGATVFADSTAIDVAGAGNADRNVYEISATTDSDGAATLSGLAQESVYNLVVPALDSDADGTYDYQTSLTWGFACTDNATTHTMELTAAGRDDAIAVVGGNYLAYDTPGAYDFAVGINDPIIVVFSYPVTAIAGAADIVSDDQAGGGATPASTASTLALSAGNTVLTITPSAALTANESYTIDGSVEAIVAGQPTYSTFAALAIDDFYAFPAAAITTSDVIGYAVGGLIRLEFSEIVNGQATVQAFTAAGVTTPVQNGAVNLAGGALALQGANVIWGINTGFGAGLVAGDTAEVYIDANDMDGNHIQADLTLTLQ